MCDIVQGFVQKGRDQEKAELVRKMLDTKFATEQQIADLLKISVKEVKKIAAKVPVKERMKTKRVKKSRQGF